MNKVRAYNLGSHAFFLFEEGLYVSFWSMAGIAHHPVVDGKIDFTSIKTVPTHAPVDELDERDYKAHGITEETLSDLENHTG